MPRFGPYDHRDDAADATAAHEPMLADLRARLDAAVGPLEWTTPIPPRVYTYPDAGRTYHVGARHWGRDIAGRDEVWARVATVAAQTLAASGFEAPASAPGPLAMSFCRPDGVRVELMARTKIAVWVEVPLTPREPKDAASRTDR